MIYSGTLNTDQKFYAQSILYYLKNDSAALRTLLGSHEEVSPEIYKLSQFRLIMRSTELSEADCIEVLNLKFSNPSLEGEKYCLLGRAYEELNDDELAAKYYLLCYQNLMPYKNKKALTGLFNYLACQSRINPEHNYLSDLNFMLEEAKKLKCYSTMGLSYHNIAKEYHRLGATKTALQLQNLAIECFAGDKLSFHYYLAISGRCHLFLDLDRRSEAQLDLEVLSTSSFEKIVSIASFLRSKLHKKGRTLGGKENLVPSWKEKACNNNFLNQLTPMEEKFVTYIVHERPKRSQILQHLYGNISLSAAENRFKNLISRFRRKHPHIIQNENEIYWIPDSLQILKGLSVR